MAVTNVVYANGLITWDYAPTPGQLEGHFAVQYQFSDSADPASFTDWSGTHYGLRIAPATYSISNSVWSYYWDFDYSPNAFSIAPGNPGSVGQYFRFRIVPGRRSFAQTQFDGFLNSAGTSGIYAYGDTPDAPAITGATFSGPTVSLTWTAPASSGDFPLTGYQVQMSSDAGANWSTVANLGAAELTYDVTGLTLGQAYLFRVAAVSDAGVGEFDTTASITPLSGPGVVKNLSFLTLDAAVFLDWETPEVDGGTPITSYIVEYSIAGSSTWTTVSLSNPLATEVKVSGLTNGIIYVFRVAAVNSFGIGSYTAELPTTSPCPDAAALVAYARELTGVFSTDIVTDVLLMRWLNEAYAELSRLYQWPWLPIVPLSTIDRPVFDCEFYTILSYRVALRILDIEADDSNRRDAYKAEYDAMLANMYNHYLRAQDAGSPLNIGELILLVRTLLDEYSQSLDDTFIESRIMNTHEELVTAESWVFPSSVFPYMGWDQARILAYGAAARIAPLAGKDEAFTNVLLEEYMAGVAHLRLQFQNNFSGRNYSAAALARQARDFLGNYSTKASDSLLKLWVYEEYQNLCSERSWAWLEKSIEITLPAGSAEFSLLTNLVKVLELHRVNTGGQAPSTGVLDTEPLVLVPSVLDVRDNDPRMYYAIDHVNWRILVAPVQTADVRLRVRYAVTPQNGFSMPTTIDGATGDAFSEFAIPDRYMHILSYRVALRAAVLSEAPQDVYNMCLKAAQDLYDAMYRDYEMAHTQEPFQLGGNALETRRYVPWFRTA